MRKCRFIFVGGSARSGTTMVQKMLCAHSRICGGPEFDHAVQAMQLYSRMSSPVQLQRQQFYYDREVLAARFREFYASLFDGVLARNPEAAYVSEKTPANISAAADLLELFPDAYYVNVVRDGRDVALSHLRVLERFKQQHGKRGQRWWSEYSIRDVSRKWNKNIDELHQLEANIALSGRVINLRYEDVVSSPRERFTPLLKKLGLDFEQQILSPESVGKEKIGFDVNVDGVWYTDGMFSQSLSSLSVSKWKQELSWRQQLQANLMQCHNLRRLGYSVPGKILKARNLIDRLRRRPVGSITLF